MTTQNVTDKILEDATKESQEIVKKFSDEAAEIKKDNAAVLKSKRSHNEDETEARKKNEHMRLLSQRKLALAREFAEHKQEYLSKVIAQAMEKFPDHAQYGQFLEMLIKTSKETDGELIIRKNDWEKYKKALEKFLKQINAHFTVTTENEITGGIIIKKGKTTYHGSLELISELLNDELAIAVSQALYGT